MIPPIVSDIEMPWSLLISNALMQLKLTETLLMHLEESTQTFTLKHRTIREKKLPNILGRWLISMQHIFKKSELSKRYPLYPKRSANTASSKAELARLLVKLFTDITPEDAANITDELSGLISDFLARHKRLPGQDKVKRLTLTYTSDEGGDSLSVENFKTPHCARVKFLVKRFGKNETILACLRYHPLNYFRGGEAASSITFANALHDIGQATYEGFASPLNCCQLGREGARFCSLFEDTDAAFHSLGNFFRLRLSEYPGGWILNPPFVESIMHDMAKCVLLTLNETKPGRFWFYIIFPRWKNSLGWQALVQSQKISARFDCRKGDFACHLCYGAINIPWYKISLFVMGSPPIDVDLLALRHRLICTDKELIKNEWKKACDR